MTCRLARFAGPLLTCMIGCCLPQSVHAMQVRLTNGSTRYGEPDPSTNESGLRLRYGTSSGYIVFGIEWNRIAEIRDESEVWIPERFNEFRAQLVRKFNERRELIDATDASESPPPALPLSARPLWQAPVTAGPSELVNSRVRFIEVDAVAANWDGDAERDGIVLRVWPMDQRGEVVRAPGTLEATLIGEGAGGDNQRIGQWVRAVRAADYGYDGVNFRLEFQNYHPERVNALWHPDQFMGLHGEVHVSLSIPSQGVFRASTGTVRLRRFSLLRERHFVGSGTRFFHYEW